MVEIPDHKVSYFLAFLKESKSLVKVFEQEVFSSLDLRVGGIDVTFNVLNVLVRLPVEKLFLLFVQPISMEKSFLDRRSLCRHFKVVFERFVGLLAKEFEFNFIFTFPAKFNFRVL